MRPNMITAPKAVTIFLSLSVPALRENAHTVVFTPSISKTGQKNVNVQAPEVKE